MVDQLLRSNLKLARSRWKADLNQFALQSLRSLTNRHEFSLVAGDLIWLERGWYVTHSGLLSLARRNRCTGIHALPVSKFCDPSARRWAFRATVYNDNKQCRGFVGYGDADPSNVSPLVHGAEMRIAETRAVNRALRKAYGIGICSVEEIGSFAGPPKSEPPVRKLPETTTGNGNNRNGTNGKANANGIRVRDRLCQLIRQHKLDAELVKSYAVDFCGTKTLREASREHVENFVAHLADWAEKDRNALLCQLNSYQHAKAGAA